MNLSLAPVFREQSWRRGKKWSEVHVDATHSGHCHLADIGAQGCPWSWPSQRFYFLALRLLCKEREGQKTFWVNEPSRCWTMGGWPWASDPHPFAPMSAAALQESWGLLLLQWHMALLSGSEWPPLTYRGGEGMVCLIPVEGLLRMRMEWGMQSDLLDLHAPVDLHPHHREWRQKQRNRGREEIHPEVGSVWCNGMKPDSDKGTTKVTQGHLRVPGGCKWGQYWAPWPQCQGWHQGVAWMTLSTVNSEASEVRGPKREMAYCKVVCK